MKKPVALAFFIFIMEAVTIAAIPHSSYKGFAEPLASYTLNNREFTFASETHVQAVTLTADDLAVYKYGFISHDGQPWQQFELSGTVLGGDWLSGSVSAYIEFNPSDFRLDQGRLSTQNNFIVVYSCSRDGSSWECHDGWQIYQFNATLHDALMDGLVSWWKFDGNANDEIGSNHGTLMNGATYATSDIQGQAVSLDGTDDYVDVGSFSVSGSQLTLSAWFIADQVPSDKDPRLISKGESTGSQDWTILIERTPTPEFRVQNGPPDYSGRVYDDAFTFSLEGWHHIAGTFDSGEAILYLDGAEVTRSTIPGTLQVNDNPVWIGGQPIQETERPFDGLIDDVRVYERALDAGEISELYESTKPVPSPWQEGMVAWWKFEGDATDSIGGNDGANHGGSFVDGKNGQALSLDLGDYVEIAGLVGEHPELTILAWVNAEQLGFYGSDIVSLGDSAVIRLTGSSVRGFYRGSDDWYETTYSHDWQAGTWMHVAYVFAPSLQKIYVDGQEAVSTSYASAVYYDRGPDTLMARNGNGDERFNFSGEIDDVMVYNRVLSSQEVYGIFSGTYAVCDSDDDCPSDSISPDYCLSGDVYRDLHDWSCSASSTCEEAITAELVQDCGSDTCISGECRPPSSVQQLEVSPDGHFLVKEDGTPFFYLGDTAWRITQRLNDADMDFYLDDRADKEFTVIQAVAVDGDDDNNPQHDLYGNYPFNGGGVNSPEEAYWQRIDTLIDKAADRGLYVALTAVWGSSLVGCCDYGFINKGNAFDYGWFLGDRYKDRDNIIWVMGGDHYIGDWDTPDVPDFSQDAMDVYDLMSEGIAAGVSGSQTFSPEQYDNLIMTYHTAGWYLIPDPEISSSAFFHDKDWLDFNTFQSGHFYERVNYGFAANDYAMSPAKPTLDFEPLYEGHYYGWDPNAGKSTTADMRNYAYWSVFAGSAGHAFGNCMIFQFWDESYDWTFDCGDTVYWKDDSIINSPGASQMKYARRLIESRTPMLERVPDQGLLDTPEGEKFSRLQATRDANGKYAMIYITNRDNTPLVTIDMSKISGSYAKIWWYDPTDGSYQDGGTIANSGVSEDFSVPSATGHDDWVLVIDDTSVGYGPPGVS